MNRNLLSIERCLKLILRQFFEYQRLRIAGQSIKFVQVLPLQSFNHTTFECKFSSCFSTTNSHLLSGNDITSTTKTVSRASISLLLFAHHQRGSYQIHRQPNRRTECCSCSCASLIQVFASLDFVVLSITEKHTIDDRIRYHLHGESSTSSQVGQPVISWRWYLGPQPLAKLMRTEFGSTGPDAYESSCQNDGDGCGPPRSGRKIRKQWPAGTRYTKNVRQPGRSSEGELTNTGHSLRLYIQTPSSSRLKVIPATQIRKRFNIIVKYKFRI